MSELVEALKKEHVLIKETLNRARKLGISSPEGQNILLSAKDSLLAHLEKEDKQLYSVLNEAAESDTDLKQTLEWFANDMDEISKAALDFFSKYSKGGSGIEFAEDFGKLFATLTLRISKEENIIYQKYDELK